MPSGPAERQLAPLRLALTVAEAAAAIGVSEDHFKRHVLPEIRVIRRGRRVLVGVKELEKWIDRSAAATLEADRR